MFDLIPEKIEPLLGGMASFSARREDNFQKKCPKRTFPSDFAKKCVWKYFIYFWQKKWAFVVFVVFVCFVCFVCFVATLSNFGLLIELRKMF